MTHTEDGVPETYALDNTRDESPALATSAGAIMGSASQRKVSAPKSTATSAAQDLVHRVIVGVDTARSRHLIPWISL